MIPLFNLCCLSVLKKSKNAFILILGFVILTSNCFAQQSIAKAAIDQEDSSWKKEYKSVSTKVNDLIHVKLIADFNYNKSELNGEVWLQLRPHFYPTHELILDAKGMDILEVSLFFNEKKSKLKYTYDSLLLNIELNRFYKASENYTVYIKYTAKPNEFKSKGSLAITDAKGLYFINPLGLQKNKPTQIWTQGETEGTSVWVPIIDKPNQKCTQEFQLIVPTKYVSLSNGLLVKQVDNKNGTRLDIWKMDLPHSPYLFFIGIGDYAIVKEEYKKIGEDKKKLELSYYVEKEYESVAKKIFGKTPEMIAFYENILGIQFPWAKYAQISGRDYVSGAMENTTATLHSDAVQQNARELIDGNSWEGTIAHELFHQWFGDLVTAESWSNLTVNESFADYSQTLWLEHSRGKDAGDYENFTGLKNYLSSPSDAEKKLVRFFYKDREDMFDLVSYQKGGRILHMLRSYLGDEAFYASLNKYLTDNKFSNGSAVKLKIAIEAITGKDLNWFFDQWYFGNGHPYVRIQQKYDPEKKQVLVIIEQTQTQEKLFTLPIGIDIYVQNQRNHYTIWTKNKLDSFYFPAIVAPDNVNVDDAKVLLWAKEEVKPLQQFIYQFYHARNLLDRYEALAEASENLKDPKAKQLVQDALMDPFYVIRAMAIHSYNPASINDSIENKIFKLANEDLSNEVREEAIDMLAMMNKPIYKNAFLKWAKDSSYIIAGAGLDGLEKLDSANAILLATGFSKGILKKRLNNSVATILAKYGDENIFDFIAEKYESLSNQSSEKFYMTTSFSELLVKTNDPSKFRKGIELIVAFRESIPSDYKNQTDSYFNVKILGNILKIKKQKGQQNLVDIVSEQLSKM